MGRDISLCVFIFSMVIRGSLQSYGYLEDPPARGSMWRFGYASPQNYNDKSLNCGGVDKLNALNGACGICGDPFDGPREHEAGGRFATGEITNTYSSAQQYLPITIRTAVYQPGYFEIRICPNNNPQRAATQECLDKHLLQLRDGMLDTNRTRYEIPPFTGDMEYTLRAEIPAGMICTQCVLQWRYISSAPGATPTSIPEEYRNCADISIDNSIPAPNTGTSIATNGATGNATDILNSNSVSNQELLSALLYLADLSPSPSPPITGTTAAAPSSNAAGSGTGGPQAPEATPTADTLLKQLLELGILVPVDTTLAPAGAGAVAGSLKANSVASTVIPAQNAGATVPKAVSTPNSAGTSNNKTTWTAEQVVGASGNPFLWYSPEISPTVAKPRTSTASPTGVLNHPVSATTATPKVKTTTAPYVLTTTAPYVAAKPTTPYIAAKPTTTLAQTTQTPQHVNNNVPTSQHRTVSVPKSAIEFVPAKRTGAPFANTQAAAGSLAGTNAIDPYVPTSQARQTQGVSNVHTNNLPLPETNNIANGVNTATGVLSPTVQPQSNHAAGKPVATTQNILDALNRIAQLPTAELSKRMQRLPTNPTVQPTGHTRNNSPNQTPTKLLSSNASKPKPVKPSPEYIVDDFNGTTALFNTDNERRRFRNILNHYSTAKRNLILKLMRNSGVNKISVTPMLSGNINSRLAPGNNEIQTGSDFMGTQEGKKMMSSLTNNGKTTPIGQFQPFTAEVQSPEVLRTRNTNVHTPEMSVGTGPDMTPNMIDNGRNMNAELNARTLANTQANSLIQRRGNINRSRPNNRQTNTQSQQRNNMMQRQNLLGGPSRGNGLPNRPAGVANSLQSLRRRANERRNRGQMFRNQNQVNSARNVMAQRNNQAQRQNAQGWLEAARRQNPFARSNNLFGRQPNPRQAQRSNNAQFNTLRMQQRGLRQGQGAMNRNLNNRRQQGFNQFRNQRAGGLSGGGQNGRSLNFPRNFQEPDAFRNEINRRPPIDFPEPPQRLPFINDRFPPNGPMIGDIGPPLSPLDGRPPLPPFGIDRGPRFPPGFGGEPGPFFPPMDNFIL